MTPPSPPARSLPDRATAAGGTHLRLSLSAAVLNRPIVTAIGAMPTHRRHAKRAPLDLKRMSIHQSQGYFAPRLGHNALKGGARNAHLFSRLCLVTPFQVGQAERL